MFIFLPQMPYFRQIMKSSNKIDKLCTWFHKKILKIGWDRAKVVLWFLTPEKHGFSPSHRMLKKIQPKTQQNFFSTFFKIFLNWDKISKICFCCFLIYMFESSELIFWSILRKKWVLENWDKIACKSAKNYFSTMTNK